MRKARDMNLGWRLASITLFSSLLISNGQAASTEDSASHGIKCWKNKEGVRECGNIVPPEYAQQGSETKDKFGVTIGTTGRAKTMQELDVERAANREQEVAAEEAKKREAADRVLLDTFTTEDDMILTRDGQVAHLDSQIHLVQSHIEKLQKNLDQMIERAAEIERRGEKPGAEVVKNIDDVRTQITDNHKFIDTKHLEQGSIRARFDRDIARFRELKGITGTAARDATASTAIPTVSAAPSAPPPTAAPRTK